MSTKTPEAAKLAAADNEARKAATLFAMQNHNMVHPNAIIDRYLNTLRAHNVELAVRPLG